jgi:hypoxanthine phosphoribosyltransferase
MEKVILCEEEIKSITSLIGQQLSTRFRFNDSPPIIIGLIEDSLPFTTDLVNEMNIPLLQDYIQIGSINGSQHLGTMLKKDVSLDIYKKDVVIVATVVDTGIQMQYLSDYLMNKYKPTSITTVALIDKKANRKVPFNLDYYGKEINTDSFLVGYGLDYRGFGRNSKIVYIPTSAEIKSWDSYTN